MNEAELMSTRECAGHILNAIEKKKRTLVLTFRGKQTVFVNKFFPAWADKLTRKFFFKNGKLVK
jgi:short-subunit dehydrogenase